MKERLQQRGKLQKALHVVSRLLECRVMRITTTPLQPRRHAAPATVATLPGASTLLDTEATGLLLILHLHYPSSLHAATPMCSACMLDSAPDVQSPDEGASFLATLSTPTLSTGRKIGKDVPLTAPRYCRAVAQRQDQAGLQQASRQARGGSTRAAQVHSGAGALLQVGCRACTAGEDSKATRLVVTARTRISAVHSSLKAGIDTPRDFALQIAVCD